MGNNYGISLGPGSYRHRVDEMIKLLEEDKFVERLWNKERELWIKGVGKEKDDVLLGWLDVIPEMQRELSSIEDFVREVKEEGFTQAVVLGMGGSSLAPLVFNCTFPFSDKGLKLTVLDSTDPATIADVESKLDLKSTLFIVSSKSGSTTEVNAFFNYFYYKVARVKHEKTGDNFAAITDEGSPLAVLAKDKKFRKLFLNFPEIGGRFSALSYFGLVPAALMGVSIKEILDRALIASEACRNRIISDNPGVLLGVILGELALEGKNKLTYSLPQELSSFGLWMEQLLAESTGKEGVGILPVKFDETDAHAPGSDRFFVNLELKPAALSLQKDLDNSFISHPLIKLGMDDLMDLGQQFFIWEIATATAGYILELNPFDQPDVQSSKKCTSDLLNKIKAEGEQDALRPLVVEGPLSFYTKDYSIGIAESLLACFLSPAGFGNYLAILAYLPEEGSVTEGLIQVQDKLKNCFALPVTCEFGPRYLHSTGQLHKGGPEGGIFLQFISETVNDIHIPGEDYTFGTLIKAQAVGDMQALQDKGRRVMLVNLGEDVKEGLLLFNDLLRKVTEQYHRAALRGQNLNSPGLSVGAAMQRKASGWI
ncbi:MAG: glucose-6-phosphate isomerase [Bacteroidia bacterium]